MQIVLATSKVTLPHRLKIGIVALSMANLFFV